MVIGNDVIGSISDEINLKNSIVEVFVSVSNRSFIKEDDNVEMLVYGLNQADFGLIKGKIINISHDSIMAEKEVFYKIYIKPETITLNKKENKIKITKGQYGDVRIKYNKTTWLNWTLNKIGIIS